MATALGISLEQAEQFLYREARLADEHRYGEWEALWTEEATYWVPANGDETDPSRQMSIIFDNRARIATRVAQFNTGKRHSQTPPSRVRRIVSNVELLEREGEEVLVGSNFIAVESRERGTQVWAGRAEHRLRVVEGELKMASKKVMLVDNDRAVHTLAFLI
jgi:3-phenylpropionate/cinnamic acid dioxygenase small subunit